MGIKSWCPKQIWLFNSMTRKLKIQSLLLWWPIYFRLPQITRGNPNVINPYGCNWHIKKDVNVTLNTKWPRHVNFDNPSFRFFFFKVLLEFLVVCFSVLLEFFMSLLFWALLVSLVVVFLNSWCSWSLSWAPSAP